VGSFEEKNDVEIKKSVRKGVR